MGCNTSKDVVSGANEESKLQRDPFPEPPSPSPVHNLSEEYREDDEETVEAVTRIQAAFRGHKTRREMQKAAAQPTREELEAEFRADDKELCNAATKIQASFRGHVARKEASQVKPKAVEELSDKMDQLQSKAEEEELDIDLSDPELHKAATKIQASFRGHKVRKDEPKQ